MSIPMQTQELVVLVDEQDRQIGVGEKLAVHRAGQLHRAFSVFLLRQNATGKIEVLLQQREQNKYHCGGLWTNTCCSHPRVDEAVAAAASRRMQEEMGITAKLYAVGNFCYRAEFSNGLIEHELDHVFMGFYQPDLEHDAGWNNFNRSEVQAVKWLELSELKHELATRQQHYTPWFAPALALIERQLIQKNLYV